MNGSPSSAATSRRVRAAAWARATFLGWVAGSIVAVVVVVALATGGVEGARAPIAASVGVVVGAMQARLVRPWVGSTVRWVCATGAGLGAPSLVGDVLVAFGAGPGWSLPAWIAAGGVLAGALQSAALGLPAARALGWTTATAAGWSLAVLTIVLIDRSGPGPDGLAGALLDLLVLGSGGIVLGMVSGIGLRLVPPRPDSGVRPDAG